MRISGRMAAALVAGGVLLGAVGSVAAQESPAPGDKRAPNGEGAAGSIKHAMRGEFVLSGRDGGPVRTVRIDRGELRSTTSDSVTIREADGTTVAIPVGAGTRIGRDGERATLGDLTEGDAVFATRVKDGDGAYATTAIRAVSPKRRAEMEQRREACRQDPRPCRDGRRSKAKRRGEAPDRPQGGSTADRGAARVPGV